MAPSSTKRALESLIAGETVSHRIRQELTYRELYENIDNLWSVLFTTGYLTQRGEEGNDRYKLAIPNQEIRQIFEEQVMEWFHADARKDTPKLDAFCATFPQADAAAVEAQFNAYLRKTISIRDTAVRKGRKESFFHGVLLGLLSHREDWLIMSNTEFGDGYSDILIELEEEGIGIVIELKYAEEGKLEEACEEALAQIEETNYEARLREDDMDTIIKYGIACYKKKCRVLVQS